MTMQFGLLSRNGRSGRTAADAWGEDLWDIVTADRLGFNEAWMAEHVIGPTPDSLPSADLFIVKAAALTKNIRLGPGIRTIACLNPVLVAVEAATVDHLTGGRYMAGWGAGGGNLFPKLGLDWSGEDRRAMMHEAVDLILKCWEERQPFDFDGRFYHGKGIVVQPKPFQQPRMPVALANSASVSTAQLAAEKGFFILHSAYEGPDQIRELAEVFDGAVESAGRPPSRKDLRILRFVHVSDSVRKAKAEMRGWVEPVIEEAMTKDVGGGAPVHIRRQLPPGMEPADVDLDWLVDSGLWLVGDPDTVYQRARDLYDQVGGFGVLLFSVGTGSGLSPRRLRRRSWKLFMEHVAPRLAALDPDREAVPV
jgi:alkanesulfonate monooxygenase SsuD/methylene tetrahydromethanopterin reductase-like flavin-dependent oxidoreductase (luciferase family)